MMSTSNGMNESFSTGAVAAHWQNNDSSSRPTSPFIIGSFLLHLFIILLITGQFAFFSKKTQPEEMIIVEMFDAPIDEKISPPEPAPTPMDKPEPLDKPVPAKKSSPPKSEARPTPKPTPAEEPLKSEAAPAPEDSVPEPAPMDKAEIEKPEPPKPAPVPAKRPDVKPTPPVKKEEQAKPEDAKKSMDFQSVLKNLAENENQPAPQEVAENEASPRQSPMLTQPPPVSEQVTQGEMQALIAQLGSCWTMLPGAKNAENLIVNVRIVVNPDRTLRSHDIVDKMRYNSDSFFRAAADTAVRALYNPDCRVLNLPPYKYDQWKSMIVSFDPKKMF
jgi:hypothetical protein